MKAEAGAGLRTRLLLLPATLILMYRRIIRRLIYDLLPCIRAGRRCTAEDWALGLRLRRRHCILRRRRGRFRRRLVDRCLYRHRVRLGSVLLLWGRRTALWEVPCVLLLRIGLPPWRWLLLPVVELPWLTSHGRESGCARWCAGWCAGWRWPSAWRIVRRRKGLLHRRDAA